MRLWSAKRSSVSPSAETSSAGWEGVRYDPARSTRRATWKVGFSRSTIRASAEPFGSNGPSGLAPTRRAMRSPRRGPLPSKHRAGTWPRRRRSPSTKPVSIVACLAHRSTGRRSPGSARTGASEAAADPSPSISRSSPSKSPLALLPVPWMYDSHLVRQKIVSPIPNARLHGQVEVDGAAWVVDGWPGMVGHNWGRAHSEAYAWAHCNAWDDGDDVVLEGFSARVRAAGILLPPVTAIGVRHHGASYLLSSLTSLVRNSSALSPRRWHFRGRAARIEVEGEMWAETDDFSRSLLPEPRRHHVLLPQFEARARRSHPAYRGSRAQVPLRSERAAIRAWNPRSASRREDGSMSAFLRESCPP